jgi:hypothetical protein
MLYDWGTLSDTGPRPLERDDELAVYLLTQGFSRAYHQQALGASNATLWKYMRWAQELGRRNPEIAELVAANTCSISREDGLLMAQRRGASHLPFWSRLAICEFLQIRSDVGKVAEMFRCSKRTVHNVRAGRCTSYDLLSGCRQLSSTQAHPPRLERAACVASPPSSRSSAKS